MTSPAEQFANRCIFALQNAFPETQELFGLDAHKILAGSWLAFDAAREQQERRFAGSVAKANGIPPSVDDVLTYLQDIAYPIDAGHFVDFYQARGWKIGKGTPMKDWKSAIRNWKREGWGKRVDGVPLSAQRSQQASLGALQVQLEKVRQEIAEIIRPGGAAHARMESNISPEEKERYNKLCLQRDVLKKRIDEFLT